MIALWRFLKSRNEKSADCIFDIHLNDTKGYDFPGLLFSRFQYNDYMFAHPDMVYFDGKKHINIEAKFIKYKSCLVHHTAMLVRTCGDAAPRPQFCMGTDDENCKTAVWPERCM